MSRLMINASELADDPEVADWLFETASVDATGDPLEILLQREAEEELDDMVWFAKQFH